MIKILIVTHGALGKGIVDSAELILGKQKFINIISVESGDSIDKLKAKVYSILEKIGDKDGVLGFVDIFGGTPSNIILEYMEKKSIHCIAGINMPMIIEALLNRENYTVEELEKRCIEVGKQGIISIDELVSKV